MDHSIWTEKLSTWTATSPRQKMVRNKCRGGCRGAASAFANCPKTRIEAREQRPHKWKCLGEFLCLHPQNCCFSLWEFASMNEAMKRLSSKWELRVEWSLSGELEVSLERCGPNTKNKKEGEKEMLISKLLRCSFKVKKYGYNKGISKNLMASLYCRFTAYQLWPTPFTLGEQKYTPSMKSIKAGGGTSSPTLAESL